MAAEIKSSGVKERQPGNQEKGKPDSSANRKKIESSSRRAIDARHKSVSTVIKSEVKAKSSSPTSSKPTTTTKSTTSVRVKEKKVYSLPGQKHDPPEEREPLRIFYESLSEQIPSSEMAEFWLMEHGLLPPDRAKKAYEKKQKRQKELRMGTPTKSPKLPIKSESSQKPQQSSRNGDVKAKKRIMKDSDDDDDIILSSRKRKMKDSDYDDDFILSSKRRKG